MFKSLELKSIGIYENEKSMYKELSEQISIKGLFTCTKIFRKLLRKFSMFIHSFSYEKIRTCVYPYERAYEHSYALTKILTNKKLCSQGIVPKT